MQSSSTITIEGDESWFEDHPITDEKGQLEPHSKGYFIIGVHSYTNVHYTIEATTKIREFDATIESEPLNLRQLFLGSQQWSTYLMAGETEYYYFQNWREESLEFSL